MLNEYRIIGRVTQEPKLLMTRSNIQFVNLSVAVSKHIKQNDGTFKEYTEFIKSSCWRNLAEYVSEYIGIGDLVMITGHIKIAKDYDIERMTNIYTNELIADSVRRLARSNKNREEYIKEETKEVKEDEISREIKEYKESQMSFKENVNTDEIEITENDLPF